MVVAWTGMVVAWTRSIPASSRRLAADLMTASRWLVAAALVLGRPSPGQVVGLTAWAWISDAVDGPLARSTGRPGRLAGLDRATDAAVGVGLLWHLGEVGFVPVVATRLVAAALITIWLSTRVLAAQMLLQTLAYGSVVWWVHVRAIPGRWALVVVILVLAGLERHRLVDELVPTFLHGWKDLLGGRADRRSSPRTGVRHP